VTDGISLPTPLEEFCKTASSFPHAAAINPVVF